VHSYLARELVRLKWAFKTVSFMAPAATVDTFNACILPHLKSGKIERYHQFHLTDVAEQNDDSCRPVLLYGRSLLYLVSESFEHGATTPILGMQKYFEADPKIAAAKARIRTWAAPSAATASTKHGDFDDDSATMKTVITQLTAP
jgi:hypothetical protein